LQLLVRLLQLPLLLIDPDRTLAQALERGDVIVKILLLDARGKRHAQQMISSTFAWWVEYCRSV